LACALALAACTNDAAKPAASKRGVAGQAVREEPRKVELVRARRMPLEGSITIAGTLAAQDEVVVRSKVAGRLASLAVDLGSPVKAGQVMAQVEAVDYRLRVDQAAAALAQAKAQLGIAPDDDSSEVVVDQTTGVREASATYEQARANFERSKTLVEKKLIGRADFDAANATFLRAQSEVQRAREDVYGRLALLRQRKAELALARQLLADTTIRSPLDGIVQMRSTTAGELLAQGAPVATVVRIDPLRMRVDIPEREAAQVAVGQAVDVRLEEDGRVYSGKIARLSPSLSQQNRTLTVEAELPNPGNLRPGSFARAVISLGAGAPVLTVPASSIVVFAGIEKVLTVEANKAIEKPIATGRRAGDMVEVLKGLRDDEAVVLAPGTLQQGQQVTVTGERTQSSAGLGTTERGLRIE
jgi:HlyD family secretion protein